jgi:hypothetical protein
MAVVTRVVRHREVVNVRSLLLMVERDCRSRTTSLLHDARTPGQASPTTVEEACPVSRRAIVVAGLSAIAIAASGCSGDSDPEAEFRAAFEKEFSAAPWYHHITGMEVTDESGRPHIEVTTDLSPGDGQPDRICGGD